MSDDWYAHIDKLGVVDLEEGLKWVRGGVEDSANK